jgi:predicted amidohydrolase
MTRTVKTVAIQMDANPAPTAERLQRAEKLIGAAVQTGAQLLVLPELFNTGYGYHEGTHEQAEPITGPTVSWLRQTAAQHQIHLAGSLMLLDNNEIYNALLLFAPDGRMWRYDKNYPWGWERGFFRNGQGFTIAQTDLGDLGLMVCWDAAHLQLWRQYAGRVDMMVISSCPPDITNPTYHLPDGRRLTADDLGQRVVSLKETGQRLFGDMINQQVAWLGVPAVHTVGTGYIETPIPNPFLSIVSFLPLAPRAFAYLPQARQIRLSCGFVKECKILDAQGHVLAQLEPEPADAFAMAEVVLADEKPIPAQPQPRSLLPKVTYLASDVSLPWLSRPTYRRGLRRRLNQTQK